MVTLTLTRRRFALLAAAFIALVALSASGLVIGLTGQARANHTFNDIATGTFFHDPTAWLADNTIADGFPDSTFRPDDTISRGQASYWFANYNERLTWQNRSSSPAANTSFSDKIGCPSGGEPIAGGGYASEPNVALTFSQPVDSEWEVIFESISGAAVLPGEVLVWALCRPGNA